MQRAAYTLPTLGASYIGKGQSRCQHYWSVQPRALLTFFPGQLKVWYFQLFQIAFPISLHSACLPPSTLLSGVTFRQTSLKWRVKKELEYFLYWLKNTVCIELPAGNFQDPCSPSLRLADLELIAVSLHWTSMTPHCFAGFIPPCSPQDTTDMCQGEVKYPEIIPWKEYNCGRSLYAPKFVLWQEELCEQFRFYPNRSRFYHTEVRSVCLEARWSGLGFCSADWAAPLLSCIQVMSRMSSWWCRINNLNYFGCLSHCIINFPRRQK